MKRIISTLLIISTAWLSAGAQTPKYRKYDPSKTPVALEKDIVCSEFITKEGRGRAQQGLEISGRYIFSLEDGGKVNVYDFRKADGKVIGSFRLASSQKDNHANNAEFGIEKAPGGSFPLMYITIGKFGSDIDATCFVESITRKGRTFSSKLVQKITLDYSRWADNGYKPIFGCPSWLVDRERGFLWVFSAKMRTTPKVTLRAQDNEYIATKFRIPKLSEGAEVRLDEKDILDQVIFPFDIWFTQAGCCRDGKIYYCYGVGLVDNARPSALRVYDTDKAEISSRYDLQGIIPYEMEDLVIKEGWIYVNTNTNPKKGQGDPVIYKLSLPK